MSSSKQPPATASATPARRVRSIGGAGLAAERSREAKQRAAAILEVLAGLRTPEQAAQALSLGVPRYYQLESQALAGLVAACEPVPRGRGRRLEDEVARLQQQCQRLERELARQQALVRLAQRSVGLAAAPAAAPAKPGTKKRRRKPAVRALAVARRLQEAEEEVAPVAAAAAEEPRTTS